MKLLEPTHIYTLGDYYASPNLREDCHNVKEGNAVTANDMAHALAEKLPKDCLLVPIPSYSGYNETFTRMLAYYADAPIAYVLGRKHINMGLYNLKKQGYIVTEEDVCLFPNGPLPEGNIVLVDNVVATGTTLSAAIRAIGKPCAVACMAVDYGAYNNYHTV